MSWCNKLASVPGAGFIFRDFIRQTPTTERDPVSTPPSDRKSADRDDELRVSSDESRQKKRVLLRA